MEAHRWVFNLIRIPEPNERIYTEECCVSFDTPKSPGGLYVDMHTFLAFGKEYVGLHYNKTKHPVYLHIEENQKSVSEGGSNNNDPEYERNYELVILPGHVTISLSSEELPETVRSAIYSVISSAEYNYQDAVQTDDEKFICEHAKNLKQLDNAVMIPPSGWKCEMCNKTDNLWLNLTDGSIHCGPSTCYNDCALSHYNMTNYPLFVELESITADTASAEVFCYDEGSVVLDPLLAQHLQHFGIDYTSLHKTEPATVEKELIQDTNFDTKCIKEGVEEVQLLSGRGYNGITNLGNSSYLSAIVQVVFSTISFCSRYYFKQPLNAAFAASPVDPTLDLNMQLAKLANGLMSGKYSMPPATKVNGKQTETVTVKQNGISPGMFKSLIVGNHPQFSTSYQQDAFEFFLHFIDEVKIINAMNRDADPTRCFKFCIEDRYEWPSGKVSYSKRNAYVLSVEIPLHEAVNNMLPLMHCLDCFTAPEESHDYASTSSNVKTTPIKTLGLASFPDYLAIQLQKFAQKGDWDPVKLDVCVDVPERIDITRMRSKIHLPGEELLPSPDSIEDTASQLVSMGVPELLSQKAVMNTSNDGKEAAMVWLQNHMNDIDINDPVIKKVEDDLPDGEGIYRLFGIVSHIGETLHTGHYVAYIHKQGRWVIFDDERVAVAKNPPMNTGYMYFFRRSG